MKPEELAAWRGRALGYLAAERPHVKLLQWAESQNPAIGVAAEKRGVTSAGVREDICLIRYVIFESLKMIMSDSQLSRARACEDGLELWRKLHVERSRSAPKVIAAKFWMYQDLQRCL